MQATWRADLYASGSGSQARWLTSRWPRAGLPEGGRVVEARHALEAELLVVVGADPLRRVDHAALQGGIDVGPGDQRGHRAEALEDLPAHAGDAELQPVDVGQAADLVAEPAAHLHAGAAEQEAGAVEVPQ